MRILLVNPPIPHVNSIEAYAANNMSETSIKMRELMGPPLALHDLAGILKDEEVRILDQKTELDLNPFYNFEHDIQNEIENFRPDIIGLTCLTAHVNSAKKIFRIIKNFSKDILTIVGGLHPSLNPQDFFTPEVDIIVIGLGKRTLRKIVDEYKKNYKNADFSRVEGIAINQNGRFLFTKQLREINIKEIEDAHYLYQFYPDRKLERQYDYRIRHNNKKVHYINTSLGCTDKCNFCGLWKFANGNFIQRKIDTVIEEIKTLEEYPVIRMVDANTFGNVPAVKELFQKLIDFGIQHEYVVDVRTDTIAQNPDLFEIAAKAGVKVAIIGLEATTDEEFKKYKKNTTVNNTIRAIEILKSLGIWVSGNYIISYDFDESDFERVAEFITAHPVYFAGFTIITPFPGTDQYELLKERIIIHNYDYYNLTNAVVKTKLPEDKFYNNIVELYKVSRQARQNLLASEGM